MADTSKDPESLEDEALSQVTGGAEYLAPGVYVEEVSFRAKNTPDLRSPAARKR